MSHLLPKSRPSDLDNLLARGEDMSATPARLRAASDSLQRLNDALRLIGRLEAEDADPHEAADEAASPVER